MLQDCTVGRAKMVIATESQPRLSRPFYWSDFRVAVLIRPP